MPDFLAGAQPLWREGSHAFGRGGGDKPCSDSGDNLSLWGIFLNVNWPVGLLFPDGRFVGLVNHHQLHVNVSAQLGTPAVRRADADTVTGSLKHQTRGLTHTH